VEINFDDNKTVKITIGVTNICSGVQNYKLKLNKKHYEQK
jgi:hypothetical protein